MAASVLNAPHFQNEDAAFAYVESRLWPHGPICPHCGNADAKRLRRMQGKTTRKGLIKCYECGKPFTVRMGTIFEVVAPAVASVAANHSSDVRQQERHFDPPNSAHARLQHENRLVLDATASAKPCVTAACRRWAAMAALSKSTKPIIGRVEGVPKPRGGFVAPMNVVLDPR